MFANEPVYFTSFIVKFLPFLCHVVFPGKAFVKVKSQVFNRLCLGYDRLVDVHWGALSSPQSESYVLGLGFIYLQSPLLSPIFNNV
jgi:hypothetical protein